MAEKEISTTRKRSSPNFKALLDRGRKKNRNVDRPTEKEISRNDEQRLQTGVKISSCLSRRRKFSPYLSERRGERGRKNWTLDFDDDVKVAPLNTKGLLTVRRKCLGLWGEEGKSRATQKWDACHPRDGAPRKNFQEGAEKNRVFSPCY